MDGERGHGTRERLLRRGRRLELGTLAWNVVGVAVLAVAALSARSVALAGFGLDSLIEIGASTVVLWELADVAGARQQRGPPASSVLRSLCSRCTSRCRAPSSW
jgi:hypothetical protein